MKKYSIYFLIRNYKQIILLFYRISRFNYWNNTSLNKLVPVVLLYFLEFSALLPTPPEIFLDKNYFSPNYDGYRDTLKINLKNIRNDKNITDWKLIITDESGNILREYKAYHGERFSKSFIGKIFKANRTELRNIIPEFIEWTGTDMSGRLLNDGRYKIQFYVIYSDQKENARDKYFYLDSKTPTGRIVADSHFLSPNNDRLNDSIVINHYFDGEVNDRWRGYFYDLNGQPVKSYIWETVRMPRQISWDGRDDRGILLDDGIYGYKLISEDFSENSFIDSLDFIQLSREDKPDIFPESLEFSPNGDGIKDKIIFKINLGNDKAIDKWKIIVRNTKKPDKYYVERVFNYDLNEKIKNPISWEWDGSLQNNKIAPEGEYEVILLVYSENKLKSSIPKRLILNQEKPEINFHIEGNNFTPDGDYNNDTITFYPKIKNLSIKTWKLTIAEKIKDYKQDRILKQWNGYNEVPPILWDGISDDGIQVSSLSDFSLYFSFRNEFNEFKVYQVQEFSSGILVNQVNKDDFRITIPEYIFSKREQDKVLNQLKYVLSEFPGFYYLIHSHAKNLDLSMAMKKTEDRAKKIYNELIRKEDKKERFDFRGCGALKLLYEDDNWYKQEKNNRLEIVVSKAPKQKTDYCK